MNKSELAQVLHDRVGGLSKSQAEKMLDEFTKVVTEKLKNGEEVVLAGFGAFSARKRKGRIGVNPRNVKEKIEIPSVVVAKFKPGKKLKDILKGRVATPVMEESGIKNQESREEDKEKVSVEQAPAPETPEPQEPMTEEPK